MVGDNKKLKTDDVNIARVFVKCQTVNAEGTATFAQDNKIFEIVNLDCT